MLLEMPVNTSYDAPILNSPCSLERQWTVASRMQQSVCSALKISVHLITLNRQFRDSQ